MLRPCDHFIICFFIISFLSENTDFKTRSDRRNISSFGERISEQDYKQTQERRIILSSVAMTFSRDSVRHSFLFN